MTVTTFDPSEGPTPEQEAAEAAALEAGEKLVRAAEEDRDRLYQQAEAENENLIAGKFKSQEDLLKAYEELQKKLGQDAPEPDQEPSEEQEEAPEEEVEEEAPVSEAVRYMEELGKQYDSNGELNDEAIEKLGEMDSKELVKAYLEYNAKAKQATLQQSQVNEIMDSVGGAEAYSDMIQWAGQNLDPAEVADFNAVTQTNNPIAIRFAVQALSSKYRAAEGYEAELVTGRKGAPSVKGYRSQAELARDIADPRYATDPAFRMDVEQKLARSGDLL